MVSLAIRLDEARRLLRLAAPQTRGLRKVVLNTKRGRRAYWIGKKPVKKIQPRTGFISASEAGLPHDKVKRPEKDIVIRKSVGKDHSVLYIGRKGLVNIRVNNSADIGLANVDPQNRVRIAKSLADSFREYCLTAEDYTILSCSPSDNDPVLTTKKARLYHAAGFDKETMTAYVMNGRLNPVDQQWVEEWIKYESEGSREYDVDDFDQNGYDSQGFNRYGYGYDGLDRDGYSEVGEDEEGFNIIGRNYESGLDRNGLPYRTQNAYDLSILPEELNLPQTMTMNVNSINGNNFTMEIDSSGYVNMYSESADLSQYEEARLERDMFLKLRDTYMAMPDNTFIRVELRQTDYDETKEGSQRLYETAGFDKDSMSAIVRDGILYPVDRNWLRLFGYLSEDIYNEDFHFLPEEEKKEYTKQAAEKAALDIASRKGVY